MNENMNGNAIRYEEVFGGCPIVEGGDCAMDTTGIDMSASTTEGAHDPSKYGFKYDANFVTTSTQELSQQQLTLEANLSTSQSLLSKEAIRQAYLNLADHCILTCKFPEALNHLRRAKEYTSNWHQSQEITLLMAEVGINSCNFTTVRNLYDPHMESTTSGGSGSSGGGGGNGGDKSKKQHSSSLGGKGNSSGVFNSKLNAARGLAYLSEGLFTEAARSFLSITSELTNGFNTVLSARDIAVYGGLMALLTLDRSEVANTLVEKNTSFRDRLDKVPLLRDAIRAYVQADYGNCLSLVDQIRGEWEMDMYLKPHAKNLWKRVRGKCLVQYFEPYISVSLQSIMESFAFESIEEAEETVVELIESKDIVGAKIHGVDRTLTKYTVEDVEKRKRRMMMRKLGRMGDGLLDEVEGMILRMACVENGLIVGKKARGGKSKSRRRDFNHLAMSRNAWGLDSSDDEGTPMDADEDYLMETD